MLDSKQRSYLNSISSEQAVVTHLGKAGPSEPFAAQLERLLAIHELVKVRFVDFKEDRKEIARGLAESTASELVRVIGNTAIFYRRNPDPEKRTIVLP